MERTDRLRAILISYNKEDTLMPESEESIREMPLVIIESPFAGDVDTKKLKICKGLHARLTLYLKPHCISLPFRGSLFGGAVPPHFMIFFAITS
jgi:hypothetical protein